MIKRKRGGQYKEIKSEWVVFINDNPEMPQSTIAKQIGVSRNFVGKIIKEYSLKRGLRKTETPKRILNKGVKKRDFFNYDIYSCGEIINRKTGIWVKIKRRKTYNIVGGKKYYYNTSRIPLYIDYEGIKKTVLISAEKLIATLFVKNDNPSNKVYVRFKDGNHSNFNSENLYWTEKHHKNGVIKIKYQQLKKIYKKIDISKLSKHSLPVYYAFIDKSPLPILGWLKKEKRYFFSIMQDVWAKNSNLKISGSALDYIYNKFTDNIYSLIERGFYYPKDDKSHDFINYCKAHLIGMVKNYIYRELPKKIRFNELSIPVSLLPKLSSHQIHSFK